MLNITLFASQLPVKKNNRLQIWSHFKLPLHLPIRSNEKANNVKIKNIWLAHSRCDLIATLFVQYLSIYRNEN